LPSTIPSMRSGPAEQLRGENLVRPAPEWWRPDEASAGESRPWTQGIVVPSDSSGPFIALLVFTFVLLIAPQSIYPALESLRPAWLSAAAAGALLLFDRYPSGPWLIPCRETRAALCLVGWSVLTVPFSYWPGGSVSMILQLYVKTLTIFWLLSLTVNSPHRLQTVAWTLSLLAIPLAYSGISNFVSGQFIQGGSHNRIFGYEGALTSNPNDLALMLNLIIPFAIALLSIHPSLYTRLLLLAVIGLCVAAIVVTFSRGGFVTLAALWFFYMLKHGRRGKLGWPLIALLVALFCIPLLPHGYMSRLGTITDIETDETFSAQSRWEGMVAGVKFVALHPLVGDGIGMSVLALNDMLGDRWIVVHSAYLEYAMDLGLPGLALYLTLLVGAIRSATFVFQRSAGISSLRVVCSLGEGLQASLLAFAVGAFFSPVGYHFYFYYLAGLAVGARQMCERSIGPRESPPA
jgi:probable O-glycosylation ligase (exosortase A-associated)